MYHDADVRRCCVAILENTGPDNRVRSHVSFVHEEDDEAERTHGEGHIGAPGAPWVGYATPRQWDQEAGRGGDEDYRADPVDFGKLLEERTPRGEELDEEGDHD